MYSRKSIFLLQIGGLNVDPSRSQFSVYPYSPMQRSIYTPITRYYPLNPSVQYQSYPGNVSDDFVTKIVNRDCAMSL